MPAVISQRALGRALLARQRLLERAPMPVPSAVAHLVALQAQVPIDPYVCLWSRIQSFDPQDLSRLLEERMAVRATLLRGTIHLTTSDDYLGMRPLMQPMLERLFATGSPFGRRLQGLDLEAVLAAARPVLDERPRTRSELRPILAERWPDRDRDALVYAVSYLEPLVQATPRGLWGRSGQPTLARAETWLGTRSTGDVSIQDLVLRYLAAFGPASAADAQAWSGLSRLGGVFEGLRDRLVSFRTEAGRELFDLPDAPRPDPETPAPVRFLPQYDNVMLGHADRSRIVSAEMRDRGWSDVWVGPFLVDGMGAGTWRITGTAAAPIMEIEPFVSLMRTRRDEVAAEAEALLAFLRPRATARDLRWVSAS